MMMWVSSDFDLAGGPTEHAWSQESSPKLPKAKDVRDAADSFMLLSRCWLEDV